MVADTSIAIEPKRISISIRICTDALRAGNGFAIEFTWTDDKAFYPVSPGVYPQLLGAKPMYLFLKPVLLFRRFNEP
jgi:hypothetical protein